MFQEKDFASVNSDCGFYYTMSGPASNCNYSFIFSEKFSIIINFHRVLSNPLPDFPANKNL